MLFTKTVSVMGDVLCKQVYWALSIEYRLNIMSVIKRFELILFFDLFFFSFCIPTVFVLLCFRRPPRSGHFYQLGNPFNQSMQTIDSHPWAWSCLAFVPVPESFDQMHQLALPRTDPGGGCDRRWIIINDYLSSEMCCAFCGWTVSLSTLDCN